MGLEDAGARWGEAHWFLGAGRWSRRAAARRPGRLVPRRCVRSRQVAAALGEKWPGGAVHDDANFAANTHVIRHAGRVLATVEAGPLPYQLTDELETVGPCDFEGKLPGGYAAHTKLDRRTAELHAIAYYWAWDYIQHLVVDTAGQVTRTANIPVPDGPMMHDFALTGRYVVLFDLPVTFSMNTVSAGRKLPYTWNAAHQARVGLLPRSGPAASVRWFEVEPCWMFHTLNAYDDGDRVVANLVRYGGPYDASDLTGKGPLALERWTIDPGSGQVSQQRLHDRAQDYPLDDRIVSQPHRYGYSASIGEVSRNTVSLSGDFADGRIANALLKHDLGRGSTRSARIRPGRHRR